MCVCVCVCVCRYVCLFLSGVVRSGLLFIVWGLVTHDCTQHITLYSLSSTFAFILKGVRANAHRVRRYHSEIEFRPWITSGALCDEARVGRRRRGAGMPYLPCAQLRTSQTQDPVSTCICVQGGCWGRDVSQTISISAIRHPPSTIQH